MNNTLLRHAVNTGPCGLSGSVPAADGSRKVFIHPTRSLSFSRDNCISSSPVLDTSHRTINASLECCSGDFTQHPNYGVARYLQRGIFDRCLWDRREKVWMVQFEVIHRREAMAEPTGIVFTACR